MTKRVAHSGPAPYDRTMERHRPAGGDTPQERMDAALALGDAQVALYCALHGVTEQEARAAIRKARARGRAPSRCAEP